MHLIVFTHRLATPRSVTIGSRHLVLAIAAVLAAVIIGAIGLYYLTFRYAAEVRLPILQDMVGHLKAEESGKNSEFMRQNLNAMAVKLGEMQAQLTRLDALGERVSGLAGLKPNEFRSAEIPGRGGALLPGMRTFTMDEFSRELENLSRGVENRVDLFNVVEAELFNARLKAKRLPTVLPVNADFNASGFGMRIDPISGQQALHEGIDFIAQTGTPIYAAAGGVVLASEWHHQFGQMIEIDHGGDIVTRYAHASAVHVKPGDLVKRGQKIAAVGSSGRSTGPHLHFEVRFKGIAQNPARFLVAATKPQDAQAEVKQPPLMASSVKAPDPKAAAVAKLAETRSDKTLAPPPAPAPAAAAAKPIKVAKAATPPSAPAVAPTSRPESGIRMTVTPIYRDGPPAAAVASAAPVAPVAPVAPAPPGLPANP